MGRFVLSYKLCSLLALPEPEARRLADLRYWRKSALRLCALLYQVGLNTYNICRLGSDCFGESVRCRGFPR
jgi:hypothetical protein